MAVTYHTPTFAALLHYVDCFNACRLAPWAWATALVAPPRPPSAPPGAGAASSSAAAAAPGAALPPAAVGGGQGRSQGRGHRVPPLPASPVPVSDMVLRSFGAHGTPVLGVLRLEGNTITLHCPGLAAQLPYEHNAHVDIIRMGGGGAAGGGKKGTAVPDAATAAAAAEGAAGAAGPGAAPADSTAEQLRYSLTVVLQNINASVVGEEACGCLRVRCRCANLRPRPTCLLNLSATFLPASCIAAAHSRPPSRLPVPCCALRVALHGAQMPPRT